MQGRRNTADSYSPLPGKDVLAVFSISKITKKGLNSLYYKIKYVTLPNIYVCGEPTGQPHRQLVSTIKAKRKDKKKWDEL